MQNLDYHGLTMCLIDATLAAGTTTTISTTGTTHYCIDGKAYTAAAKTNAATPTTDVNSGSAFTAVPVSKGCVFVVGLDSTGAVKVAQGDLASMTGEADGANATFIETADFPGLPNTVCPIGYIVVKVGASGSSWTFGSSNLSSVSNVSFSFTSVATLPSRPQIS